MNYMSFIKEAGLDDTIYHEKAKIGALESSYR